MTNAIDKDREALAKSIEQVAKKQARLADKERRINGQKKKKRDTQLFHLGVIAMQLLKHDDKLLSRFEVGFSEIFKKDDKRAADAFDMGAREGNFFEQLRADRLCNLGDPKTSAMQSRDGTPSVVGGLPAASQPKATNGSQPTSGAAPKAVSSAATSS